MSFSKSGANYYANLRMTLNWWLLRNNKAFIVPSKFLSLIASITAIEGIITSMLLLFYSKSSTIFSVVSRTLAFLLQYSYSSFSKTTRTSRAAVIIWWFEDSSLRRSIKIKTISEAFCCKQIIFIKSLDKILTYSL